MEPKELSENKSIVASASGVVEDAERYDPGLSAPKKLGMTIFIVIFGFCGSWAAFAPIDGAAVASGFVNVRSYSKVVQHLEGASSATYSWRTAHACKEANPFWN